MTTATGLRQGILDAFRAALVIPNGSLMTNGAGEQVLDSAGNPRVWNYDVTQIEIGDKPYAAEQVKPDEIPWRFVACDKSRVDYMANTNMGNSEHTCDVKVFLEIRPDSSRWGSATAETLIEWLIDDVVAAVELFVSTPCGHVASVDVERLIDDLGAFALAEVTFSVVLRPKRAR